MYESPSEATEAVPMPGPSALAAALHAAHVATASAVARIATRACAASVPARPIDAPFDRARDDLPRRPCAPPMLPRSWLAGQFASVARGGGTRRRDATHRTLGERGDREARVHADVRRDRGPVADEQVLVAEDAMVRVDNA